MTSRPARTPREVLVAARWILERHGWIQHALRGPCGFCMRGAMGSVMCVNEDVRWLALELLPQGCFTGWNDTPGRTKAEVLAAFDRAIESAGKGGP